MVSGPHRPEPLGQLGINSSIDKYFPFNLRTDEWFAVDSFDSLTKESYPAVTPAISKTALVERDTALR